MADECSETDCCKVPVCLKFVCVEATDEFKEQMKVIFCEIFSDLCGSIPEFGCPDQTGDTVILCYDGEMIEVPQAEVNGLLAAGAVCGECGEACCPDTPVIDGKIEMCLNGKTKNVSVNACKGLLTAGATCGACEIS